MNTTTDALDRIEFAIRGALRTHQEAGYALGRSIYAAPATRALFEDDTSAQAADEATREAWEALFEVFEEGELARALRRAIMFSRDRGLDQARSTYASDEIRSLFEDTARVTEQRWNSACEQVWAIFFKEAGR